MTEGGWERSRKPFVMLQSLSRHTSKRKLRLFACSIARFEWCYDMGDVDARARLQHVVSAEHAADDKSPRMFTDPGRYFFPDVRGLTVREAQMAAFWAASSGGGEVGRKTGPEWQANALRDIFGNPFRPVAFLPEWRSATAVGLARFMYDGRNFVNMPVLADVLEEAGCDHADVLAHCRDAAGVHVRGCWVVDLVLGKS